MGAINIIAGLVDGGVQVFQFFMEATAPVSVCM